MDKLPVFNHGPVDVPLLEHLDLYFKAIEQHFVLLERAICKSDEDYARRFTEHNQFRGQLKDQAGTFATKDALDAVREGFRNELKAVREEALRAVKTNAEAIVLLERANSKAMGRQEALTWGIGIAFTILSLALKFL